MLYKIKNFYQKSKENIILLKNYLINFYKDTRNKLENLYETNYNNGINHLKKGHLFEATTRFKIMKKIFPTRIEPQIKYAYCLILNKLEKSAEELLNDIIKENPKSSEAQDLLNKIKNNEINLLIEEYENETKSLEKNENK